MHRAPLREPSLLLCRNIFPDVRRFFWEATEDEKIGKIRTSLTWPYKEELVNELAMSGLAAAKPAHIGQKDLKDGLCCPGRQIVYRGWSLCRGQKSSICEDSSPPPASLFRATRQKPRSQTVNDIPKHPGGAFGLTYRHCGKKLDRSNRSERRLHCIQTRIRCST